MGRISLEDALFIGDLVFWSGRSLPVARRLSIGVSYPPIYILAVFPYILEVILKEAEIVACYN